MSHEGYCCFWFIYNGKIIERYHKDIFNYSNEKNIEEIKSSFENCSKKSQNIDKELDINKFLDDNEKISIKSSILFQPSTARAFWMQFPWRSM